MNNKLHRKWIIAERKSGDILEHLLVLRGVEDRESFMHPQFDLRHDPFLLPQMSQAVKRIIKAIEQKEIIGLYGDYDCDGIPGTALLYRALNEIGAKIEVFIPKREVGYGLSKEGIDDLKQRGATLIITIDNGTTAIEQVAYANTQEIEVIITDHHEPHSEVPSAIIINPKLASSKYPFRELCGTGVVFKLIEALSAHFQQLDEKWLKWHLDLVALATICDMVELQGENRILATYGLTVLQKTRNIGLQELIKIAGVNPEVLSAGTVGFGLGPRINAAGRMEGDPLLGFRLLITDDAQEAKKIAITLHELNQQRQSLVQDAVAEAEELLKKNTMTAAIVLQHPSWTPGILGLIASKLQERYHKPTLIFDAKSGKGSARSIEDFPLPQALEKVAEHFLSYGGHALAAGMTLRKGAFQPMQQAVQAIAAQQLGEEERAPHLHIDALLNVSDIHPGLTKKLAALEPHGIGNPRPLFAVQDVSLDSVKFIGAGNKHIRGTAHQKGAKVAFVAFGAGDRIDEFKQQKPVALAGRIEENYWNGRTSAELHVVDINSSQSA